MIFTEIIGLIAGALTTFAFVPQLVKTVKTKSTKDISLGMFAIVTTGIFLWLIYGILKPALPVIIANGISFPMCCVLLALKIKYK